jgi:hypothetical protein
MHVDGTKTPEVRSIQCNRMLKYSIMDVYVSVVVRPETEKRRRLEINYFLLRVRSVVTTTVNTSGMGVLKYCFRYRVVVRFMGIFW